MDEPRASEATPATPQGDSEQAASTPAPAEDHSPELPTLDPQKVVAYYAKLRSEQRLSVGIGMGFGAAVGSAAIWAVVTVAAGGRQIGWMAVAVGFAVGFAVRFGGRGIDPKFRAAGALLAAFGCLLGNYLAVVGMICDQLHLDFFGSLFHLSYKATWALIRIGFRPMDLLFYAIALYEGYRFAVRPVTQEELWRHARSGGA